MTGPAGVNLYGPSVALSPLPQSGAEKQRRQSRGGLFRRRLRREGRPPAGQSLGPPPPPAGAAAVAAWNTEEVVTWLESIALPEYRNSFIRHDVRGPELLSLERRSAGRPARQGLDGGSCQYRPVTLITDVSLIIYTVHDAFAYTLHTTTTWAARRGIWLTGAPGAAADQRLSRVSGT